MLSCPDRVCAVKLFNEAWRHGVSEQTLRSHTDVAILNPNPNSNVHQIPIIIITILIPLPVTHHTSIAMLLLSCPTRHGGMEVRMLQGNVDS